MKTAEILSRRLLNQRIAWTEFERPEQVAAWFGAMQAQEYGHVKWAVGLRGRGLTQSSVEQAVAERRLVRTWLNRGTLHLTAAADVRWMLNLLSPRTIASSARRSRELNLDAPDYEHALAILAGALAGGRPLTRGELMIALEQGGVSPEGQRGYHILARAGQEGLICFGPNQGKQQTFVLLDEWVEPSRHREREEALAELAGRYFGSHGPATLADFGWWSGLTAGDARQGLESVQGSLQRTGLNGADYYWRETASDARPQGRPAVFLLPGFDEYFLGYRERTLILENGFDKRLISSNGIFRPMLVVDGRVVGGWKMTVVRSEATVAVKPFQPLQEAEAQALAAAANHYSTYLERPVSLELQ